MRPAVPAFGLGLLAGLLLALALTGGADARPATRAAIPAAPMGVVEPDLREWRTWTAPPSPAPAAATVVPATVAPEQAPTPRVQPDPSPVAERITPRPSRQPAAARRGTASWFGAPAGTAAAGRSLRAFLGRGWRHDRVRVCGPAGCAVVRLEDWMGHPRRIVDLNPGAFGRVCGDLRRGVCEVTVTRA